MTDSINTKIFDAIMKIAEENGLCAGMWQREKNGGGVPENFWT